MTAPRLAPGAVVANKYRIHAMLAFGGSAATYQAATSEAQVALKMLSPELARRQDMTAALQQFNAGTNALSADLVVPVVDFGFDQATGAPFSATTLLRVPTLAQLVAQRPLSPEETASLVTGIARAIDAAHARQMAHHALKPNNVFVGPAPITGVRVMDFGASLARSITPTQEGYEQSAPWMAPEQVKASAPAGAPADIFSAALLAFYALTGRSYWRSCQQQRPNIPEWQREVVSPQVAASQRGTEVGFPLNPALDPAFSRALTLNPGERYRSVGEFAAALSAIATPRGHAIVPSEATMAFPLSAFEPPPGAVGPAAGRGADSSPASSGGRAEGGYPPPPPPTAAQPMPLPQQGYASQAGPPGQGMPPSGSSAPVEARSPSSPAGQPTPAPSTAPAKGGKTVTIVVGAIAAVILLGGAAAAFFISKSKGDDKTVTAPSATPSAAAPVRAEATASAEPSAAAPTEPAVASAEPAASGAAAPDADAGPAEVSVKITCDPACGELKVDDKAVDDPAALALPPGKHRILVSKEGFFPKTDAITVVAGQPLEKEYKLTEKATAAAAGTGVPALGTAKPCGKFLKACK